MMPIGELVRFAGTLDGDWRSPLAEAAAEKWGVERPRFIRSSASHVFVATAPRRGPRVVLRMRPKELDGLEVLGRGSRAAHAWRTAGGPFVDAIPSLRGRFIESIRGYAVTAQVAAEGETLEDLGVTDAKAHEWGRALGRLHDAGSASELLDLPISGQLLRETQFEPALASVAEDLRCQLGELPRHPAVYGVLHGDPEPDNVIVAAAGMVLIDPDEVRCGWFVSDVAFALRAFADPAGQLVWAAGGVPAAFVDGYRSVRCLTGEELHWAGLFSRVAALEELSKLASLWSEPVCTSWPEWAVALHARVGTRAAALRARLIPPEPL